MRQRNFYQEIDKKYSQKFNYWIFQSLTPLHIHIKLENGGKQGKE